MHIASAMEKVNFVLEMDMSYLENFDKLSSKFHLSGIFFYLKLEFLQITMDIQEGHRQLRNLKLPLKKHLEWMLVRVQQRNNAP